VTQSFRRKLLPLVIGASLVVAFSAPAAFYLQKRAELVGDARDGAARAGRIVLEAARERPRLWQYDAGKLAERFAAEGLGQRRLVVRDARGADVPVGTPPRGRLLWGRAPVLLDGRRVAVIWAAADGAALWSATLRLALLFMLLAIALGAVLYLLPVRAVDAGARQIAALMGRLAEDDRRRIARDLHDGAGQALTAARLRLQALRLDGVQAITAHLDEALDEIRRSTAALLPPALADLGLAGAVERHCRSFGEAAGLEVRCQLAELPPLPAPVEIACYRIVQEALHNTARHARATSAWVRLASDGARLHLDIGDDGVGGVERLQSIRERVRLMGGTLEASGSGLQVRMPLV
jgi:signal transduction histidine kinase